MSTSTNSSSNNNNNLFAAPFASRYTQQSGASYYSASSSRQTNHNPFRGSKQRSDSRVMKQAMRVVLLSPLVVLALYSVLVTSRSLQPSVSQSTVSQMTPAKTSTSSSSSRLQHLQHHKAKPNLKRFAHAKEHLLNVVEVVGEALGEEQPEQVVMLTATNEQQQAAQVMQAEPLRGAAVVVQPDYSQVVAMEQPQQQAAAAMILPEAVPLQGQAVTAQAPLPLQALAQEGALSSVQQAAAVTLPESVPLVAAASTPALTKSQSQQQPVVYLYYDPRRLQTNAQGQVVLPDQLYDAQGRSVSTTALVQQQSSQRKVYLEPPRAMAAPTPVLTMEAPVMGAAAVAVPEVPVLLAATDGTETEIPPQQLAIPTLNQSTDTLYDQSILVSTVGIMALLVGAISARRMRSRSHWLQVCIENESLEDDAAYDDAHTIVGENSDYGTYNTFGWKGDLEKFDV